MHLKVLDCQHCGYLGKLILALVFLSCVVSSCVFLMWYSECGQQLTMQLKAKVMVYVYTFVHTERWAEKLPEVLKAEQ